MSTPASRSASSSGPRPGLLAVLAGAAAVIVLGLLTIGVQASVRPHDMPVAVAVPTGAPVAAQTAAREIAARGGDALDWQVVDPARAAQLLDDKDIYGYLTLDTRPGASPGGTGLSPTVTVSGATLPTATQAAEGALRAVAAAITGPGAPASQVITVNPTSPAAKVLPLAAVTLLWIGGLAATGVLLLLARRAGRPPTPSARLLVVVGTGVVGTLLVVTYSQIWDGSTIDWNWPAALLLVLTGVTFAALQGAVTRLLGLAGFPILALLYLMAPAVSGQPPELLHPGYRVLLWSWTPFRIGGEALRSLLYSPTTPDDVVVAWIVFPILAALALLVILWPSRRSAPIPDPDLTPAHPSPGRHRAAAGLAPVMVLDAITHRLEQGTAPPALTAAAAQLAPATHEGATDEHMDNGGGNSPFSSPTAESVADRARRAAREVLRPAIGRAVLHGLPDDAGTERRPAPTTRS